MLRVAAFDLGKGKDNYCTGYGPVTSRLPVISMSSRFHDITVETADITSRVFFCKRFFVWFQDSFNTTKPFRLLYFKYKNSRA